jgi:NAD(P)-dependent dehydrogenase (short-subunit alcohol dehydrogenase family)
VTGSSRGIGNALARALADAGATVVLNGVNEDRLKNAEAAMAAEYPAGRVQSCAFDVTSDAQAAHGVAWVEDNVGRLEILVNNAGIQHRVPMLELDVTDLGTGDLHGPDQRVPGGPRSGAAHDSPRARQDHQHLLCADGPTPAHRWGTVEDLAGPAVWLASDGSNFVNGQTIFIDGGMTVVV